MSDFTVWNQQPPTTPAPSPASANVINRFAPHLHQISDDYVIIQEPSQTRAILADKSRVIREPQRGCEVIMLNLPRNILMRRIYDFMASCGPIYEIRLLMEFSGFNKGMCYVKYFRDQTAQMAALLLDRCEIQPGVKVYIKISQDNNRLRISNIPKKIPANQVNLVIQMGGGRGLADVQLRDDLMSGSNYQQVLLEYHTHKQALLAKRHLMTSLERLDYGIRIEWIEPVDYKTKTSSTLYFKNFPEHLTRADLYDFLSKTIDIQTVMKIHVEKGCGYIMFFKCIYRKIAEQILEFARPSGRKLELRTKKPSPISDSTNYQNSTLQAKYGDAFSDSEEYQVRNIPIFNLPDLVTEPGIENEQFAINQTILQFTATVYPNISWTVLEQEHTAPKGTIKLLLRVNGEDYSFLLAPRSTD